MAMRIFAVKSYHGFHKAIPFNLPGNYLSNNWNTDESMRIVFFANPNFFGGKKVPLFASMPRYLSILRDGMRAKGHEVEIWSPTPRAHKLPMSWAKKYLGYLDQYVIFPLEVRARIIRNRKHDTLFVFTDQAQGPWVNLVKDKFHVIHCHDFLSQFSALGMIRENDTALSGKIYQKYILEGLRKSKN